ncbi:hypothetical protein R5M92_07630 [Halomonas sp. Bachu 37]|uniref:hypothetical protein n=1 Tax=Halomonas kashgarensis TaxID=3084920 RepID=UPI003216D225
MSLPFNNTCRFNSVFAGVLCTAALSIAPVAFADDGSEASRERALVIVTSDSLETQSMAMILSRAMQEQGSDLHLLLCDGAGDLAVEGYASERTVAPRDIKPEGLLATMMNDGAKVDVCAIYLPNSEYEQDDLREGVGVAMPGPMAEMMRDPKIPVYTF